MNRELLRRDEWCRICGETNEDELTTHHIFPKGDKRRRLYEGQTVLCKTCHEHINLIWNKGKEIAIEIKNKIKQFYTKD